MSLVGKLNRGLSVIDSYRLLKGEELTDDEIFLASALGWCIEWVITIFFQPLIFYSRTNFFHRMIHDALMITDLQYCSFKHTFLCLMISWMSLILEEVNPVGSDYPRCESFNNNLFIHIVSINLKI